LQTTFSLGAKRQLFTECCVARVELKHSLLVGVNSLVEALPHESEPIRFIFYCLEFTRKPIGISIQAEAFHGDQALNLSPEASVRSRALSQPSPNKRWRSR
jgi:hypothetical protein